MARPTTTRPTTVVIARRVSHVAVEVTSEYTRKLARFVDSGAPASYEMPVPAPTAKGQNQRFITSPNT